MIWAQMFVCLASGILFSSFMGLCGNVKRIREILEDEEEVSE